MKVIITLDELRAARQMLEGPVGLIPTMGFLHAGHISLVRRAHQECASIVVSIFVNPTQFGPKEDLAAYPRDLKRDLALLTPEGVDLVWTPTPEVMYPPGYQAWVTVAEVSQPLEGGVRPGHFRGVTTVVAKLFNAIQPQKAYFGQKDAQQVAVIRRMALDLNFPLEVVVCPILREPDGLAMSSRNVYLSAEERQAATILYRSLTTARNAFEQSERDASRLRSIMMGVLNSEPSARPQYVSCADPNTLQELEIIVDQALLSMAVYIGKTRLIDNLILGEK